jgi:hypothetical protein
MKEFISIANAKKETGLSYLGGVATSSKISHSKTYSHQHTYAIYLAPANTSGYNVCSHATKECKMGCLNTSGRAGIEEFSGLTMIHDCRVKKTRMFFEDQDYFMNWMIAEIKLYQRKAAKDGFFFSVRLNATSDIDWTNVFLNNKNIFEIFPEVSFYDYSKSHLKFDNIPNNYHLTYSYTGRNAELCKVLLNKGVNIAVVFNVRKETELPKTFMGYPTVNGDLTDYRINDAKGIIVALKWKRIANRINEAKILKSCFVIQPNDIRCGYKSINVQKEINELVMV